MRRACQVFGTVTVYRKLRFWYHGCLGARPFFNGIFIVSHAFLNPAHYCRSVVLAAFASAVVIGTAAGPAAAQSPTEQQIQQQLIKRSFKVEPGAGPAAGAPAAGTPASQAAPPADEARLQDLLKRTRAFSVKERAELAEIADTRPSIDMEVQFDFNSAAIGPKAAEQLDRLGRALASSELKGGSFMLAGHTDAKGKPQINLALSQKRAEAVRDYLVTKHQVDKSKLTAVGFGEEKLKDTRHPNADVNRRVQIVNVSVQQAH